MNVILVHRFKKYLFRIEADPQSGTQKLQKFDLQAGIAGFVTISSHSVMTEKVESDSKFNQEIDDPLGTIESPAR